eukprot:scaffold76745_cov60-Phaeocystis_antarctica.AAC.1
MRTFPTGIPPASRTCTRCSGCAPRLFCPHSAVEPSTARWTRRRPRLLSRTLAPHRMPCFRLSAGRVGVQPAAELRHLQRHEHGLHVRGALLPVPCPSLQSSPALHAACTAIARRLPPPGPHVAPHRMPSFRLSAGGVGVQPAAELRHLQ